MQQLMLILYPLSKFREIPSEEVRVIARFSWKISWNYHLFGQLRPDVQAPGYLPTIETHEPPPGFLLKIDGEPARTDGLGEPLRYVSVGEFLGLKFPRLVPEALQAALWSFEDLSATTPIILYWMAPKEDTA